MLWKPGDQVWLQLRQCSEQEFVEAVSASLGCSIMLTVPALTLILLAVIIGLGAAFVWLFWEIQQVSERRGDRFG